MAFHPPVRHRPTTLTCTVRFPLTLLASNVMEDHLRDTFTRYHLSRKLA